MLKTELRKWRWISSSVGRCQLMPKAFGAKFWTVGRLCQTPPIRLAFTETPYDFGSISSRTRSSGVCRLRMRANLPPRTSASAGSGREL